MTEMLTLLRDIPRRNGNRTFLVDSFTARQYSFTDVHNTGCAAAEFLRELGLRSGDRIVVSLYNSWTTAALYFGALYLGVTVIPVGPQLAYKQKMFIVQSSRARALVATPVALVAFSQDEAFREQLILIAATDSPEPASSDAPSIHVSFDLDRLPDGSSFRPFTNTFEDSELVIVYTSGTTAEPKGVVHTIASLFGNGKLITEQLGVDRNSRFFNNLPMTYLGGYYNLLFLPYIAEASTVLAPAFSAHTVLKFWNPIIDWQVNTIWFVPTIISLLQELDRAHEGEKYCRKYLRHAFVGTAPLRAKDREAFEKRYGLTLLQNFALSETLFLTTNSPYYRSRGSGKLLPGIELRIQPDENDAENSQTGEILVKTPFLMKGYLNAATGQADVLDRSAWFSTGDVGCLDEEDNLEVVGRTKDLIIRGGINISPAAVENIICQHGNVIECAVVGIPHKIMGEEVVAVLRLRNNQELEYISKELARLCQSELASYQRPAHYLLLSEFPRTTSGKIQKARIRTWAEDQIRMSKTARNV